MDQSDVERINELLEKESEIRDRIKEQVNELDKKSRTVVGLLNKVHSTPSNALPQLIASVRPHIEGCKAISSALEKIIPSYQYWRYKEMWQNSLRNIVFAVILMEYLTSGELASLELVSDTLGIREEWHDRLQLAIEDYLHGLISVVNELSRLAVNAVTLGNFDEPLKISAFVKDIFAGFSMLNLKNDTLRRRYDSLKYDMKKIEEVVYDISLRKLASGQSGASPSHEK